MVIKAAFIGAMEMRRTVYVTECDMYDILQWIYVLYYGLGKVLGKTFQAYECFIHTYESVVAKTLYLFTRTLYVT